MIIRKFRTAISLIKNLSIVPNIDHHTWELLHKHKVLEDKLENCIKTIDDLSRTVSELNGQIEKLANEAISDPKLDIILNELQAVKDAQEFAIRDLHVQQLTFNKDKIPQLGKLQVKTDHPIAIESDDHIHPRGTKNDNTRFPRFVARMEKHFDRKISVMDFGCAGGGLVLDFLLEGHQAIGIEGSNYSEIWQRAEWGTIPEALSTADITKPLTVTDEKGKLHKFDLITAWEFLEHIKENDLPALFSNIRNHLSKDGLFVASVATFEDIDPVTGTVYHVTIQPKKWWESILLENGLELIDIGLKVADFPRGSGNPRAFDWDASTNPEMGFHIVAKQV